MTFASGSVVAYDYLQGNSNGRKLGRVIKVRDTEINPVSDETVKKNPFIKRSQYLLTVRETDGKYRQLYGHALYNAKKIGFFGRFMLWLAGVRV